MQIKGYISCRKSTWAGCRMSKADSTWGERAITSCVFYWSIERSKCQQHFKHIPTPQHTERYIHDKDSYSTTQYAVVCSGKAIPGACPQSIPPPQLAVFKHNYKIMKFTIFFFGGGGVHPSSLFSIFKNIIIIKTPKALL